MNHSRTQQQPNELCFIHASRLEYVTLHFVLLTRSVRLFRHSSPAQSYNHSMTVCCQFYRHFFKLFLLFVFFCFFVFNALSHGLFQPPHWVFSRVDWHLAGGARQNPENSHASLPPPFFFSSQTFPFVIKSSKLGRMNRNFWRSFIVSFCVLRGVLALC